VRITVGPVSADEGSKSVGFLDALELQDGSSIAIALILIIGKKTGPKLFIGAAFHGDEANGIESIRRISNEISPNELSGTILAVPIQNPLAFRAGHRLAVNQIVRSPLDCMPADPHSMFPGNGDGNPFDRIVHRLYSDVIAKADFAIDMHQPTVGGKYVPISFVSQSGNVDTVKRSEDLAIAFGTSIVVKTKKGGYAREGNMHVYSTVNGIPSIMVELGEGGRLEEEYVHMGVEGIRNVLKHLKMIKGAPALSKQTTITEMIEVRARKGGLLHVKMELGKEVSKGDLVANIVSPTGPVVEAIKSPAAGILIRKTTFPTVISGERVAVIGT